MNATDPDPASDLEPLEPPDEYDWEGDPAFNHPGLRHPPEEIRRLGEEVFERDVRAAVRGRNPRDVVAVDAEGRGWEVAADPAEAEDALLRRVPDAQTWLRPVGGGSLYHFGGAGRER